MVTVSLSPAPGYSLSGGRQYGREEKSVLVSNLLAGIDPPVKTLNLSQYNISQFYFIRHICTYHRMHVFPEPAEKSVSVAQHAMIAM